MGFVRVQIPDHLKAVIDRQVAEGRVASEAEFLIEAARRYAADRQIEDEIVAEAEAGIADAEAGRCVTISRPEDAEMLHRQTMEHLRTRTTANLG